MSLASQQNPPRERLLSAPCNCGVTWERCSRPDDLRVSMDCRKC
jgi:hypothetical protein